MYPIISANNIAYTVHVGRLATNGGYMPIKIIGYGLVGICAPYSIPHYINTCNFLKTYSGLISVVFSLASFSQAIFSTHGSDGMERWCVNHIICNVIQDSLNNTVVQTELQY